MKKTTKPHLNQLSPMNVVNSSKKNIDTTRQTKSSPKKMHSKTNGKTKKAINKNTAGPLSTEDLQSLLESLLFVAGRPLSIPELVQVFSVEKISSAEIKTALGFLSKKYQELCSGIELKQVAGAWQLRTKAENKDYIRRLIKGRLFYLSAPALEVLVIVAYREPLKKADIDEIRGVESGHLLKTLMEKELITLGPKSLDPGRPLTYKTTPRFLEVFSLKSLKDLPSSEDIQDLLASETGDEKPTENEMQTLLDAFKEKRGHLMDEQKHVLKELEWVSTEIDSISSGGGGKPPQEKSGKLPQGGKPPQEKSKQHSTTEATL